MADPKKNKILIAISSIAIVAGLTVISGWILNMRALESILPGVEAMRFNAAMCFVFFGITLLLKQFKTCAIGTIVSYVLALAGTVIGLLTLLQDLFHFNTGLDQLFITDTTLPSYNIPIPRAHGVQRFVQFFYTWRGSAHH